MKNAKHKKIFLTCYSLKRVKNYVLIYMAVLLGHRSPPHDVLLRVSEAHLGTLQDEDGDT